MHIDNREEQIHLLNVENLVKIPYARYNFVPRIKKNSTTTSQVRVWNKMLLQSKNIYLHIAYKYPAPQSLTYKLEIMSLLAREKIQS